LYCKVSIIRAWLRKKIPQAAISGGLRLGFRISLLNFGSYLLHNYFFYNLLFWSVTAFQKVRKASIYLYFKATILFNNINSGKNLSTILRTIISSILLLIKFIVIIFSLAFIPLWLEWSMAYFCILILLTLAVIISLLLIYNSSNKKNYYNGDMLAIFTGPKKKRN
jgi:ABC-type multidrug transport system fused ATPase/permease subunit